MKKMQSYLTLFSALDRCYWNIPEGDGKEFLGMVVGSMDPEIWADGRPIDPAPALDWEAVSGSRDYCSLDEFAEDVYKFLEVYRTEFGFDVTEVQRYIKPLIDDTFWAKTAEYVERMYDEFQYDD